MNFVDSKKFDQLVAVAVAEASLSTMAMRHGAVLLSKGGKMILGSACNNLERTCVRGCSENRVGLHAEVAAVLSSTLRKQSFKRGLRRTRGGGERCCLKQQ